MGRSSHNADVPGGYVAFYQNEVTPTIREERVLRVRAAGFPRRLVAAVIDTLLVASVSAVVTVVAAVVLRVPLPTSKQLGPDLLLAGLLDRSPMVVGGGGAVPGAGRAVPDLPRRAWWGRRWASG